MQTAKQKLKRAAPWLFLLLVLAGLAAVRGLAANYEIGYEIMNGDFQNYNPVRHLLAGQVPYRDFTVYLGAGELYSVGGLLLVLGNSFGRSMFATNFCTWFYFELLVLAVCLVVIGTARAARAAALALCSVFFAYVQGPICRHAVLDRLQHHIQRRGLELFTHLVEVKTDNAVIDIHVCLMIKYIQRTCNIDFQRSGQSLCFRLFLFSQKVI